MACTNNFNESCAMRVMRCGNYVRHHATHSGIKWELLWCSYSLLVALHINVTIVVPVSLLLRKIITKFCR